MHAVAYHTLELIGRRNVIAATHNIVTWHAVDEQPVVQAAVAADVVTTEDALLSFAVKTAIFALFAFLRQHWTVCYGVWA